MIHVFNYISRVLSILLGLLLHKRSLNTRVRESQPAIPEEGTREINYCKDKVQICSLFCFGFDAASASLLLAVQSLDLLKGGIAGGHAQRVRHHLEKSPKFVHKSFLNWSPLKMNLRKKFRKGKTIINHPEITFGTVTFRTFLAKSLASSFSASLGEYTGRNSNSTLVNGWQSVSQSTVKAPWDWFHVL